MKKRAFFGPSTKIALNSTNFGRFPANTVALPGLGGAYWLISTDRAHYQKAQAMADTKSTSSTPELNVPTYIPLPEAAQKHGLSEQALTQLIQAGKIEAVQLPSGEVLVSASNNPQRRQSQ